MHSSSILCAIWLNVYNNRRFSGKYGLDLFHSRETKSLSQQTGQDGVQSMVAPTHKDQGSAEVC